MIKKYFIYLSYKGTAYHGWQYQPNGTSVQQTLSEALSTVLRTKIDIVGAGRTDTGVHAKLMVAHFEFDAISDPIKLTNKLNSILPNDIAIYKIINVKPDAHARFDATARKYEYHICLSKNVFKKEYATRLSDKLDFDKMNTAAATLHEYTDFTSFSKLHTDAKTNFCKIYQAQWTQQQDTWIFTIEADRFLRNMVRAIVGTLLEVGRNKMTIEQFRQIIEIKDRCKAGTSVPAHGLYLVDIKYPQEIFELD